MDYWKGYCIVILTCIYAFGHIDAAAGSVCIMDGESYQNGSSWHVAPCEECTCIDSVPVCHAQMCSTVHCQKGEELSLRTGECCPVCRAQQQSCSHNGTTYKSGSTWLPSQCSKCNCTNGLTTCTTCTCPAPTDSTCTAAGVMLVGVVSDPCCPRCAKDSEGGSSCLVDGVEYESGSSWRPLPCSHCVCMDGFTHCYVNQCPTLICKQGEQLHTEKGECCPRCVEKSCHDRMTTHQSGSHWRRDRCTQCVCHDSHIECHRQQCPDSLTCPLGERKMWRRENCCPICVPETGSCRDGILQRYDGETWQPVGRCDFCACTGSQIICQPVHCDSCKDTPGGGQTDEGKAAAARLSCCPPCPPLSKCQYDGSTYMNGSSWLASPCTHCLCIDGRVECGTMECPACPQGMHRTVQPTGEQGGGALCCAPCVQGSSCDAPCDSCSDAGDCERCESGFLLQEGQCVQKCSSHFYQYKQYCHACSPKCGTCVGPSPSQCTSCSTSSLLQDGRCVERCSVGYIEQEGRNREERSCVPCQRSGCGLCTSGEDGDDDDGKCLTCQYPWQQLEEGHCVDQCRPGFYQELNRCYPCSSDECSPCLGSRCSGGCPHGRLLQGSVCVAQCNQRLFNDNGICKACPPNCLWCETAGTCQQCDSRTFLLDSQCRADCGKSHSAATQTRACRENLSTPSLSSSNQIVIARLDRPTLITPAMISAHDADTTAENVHFHVIVGPRNGDIVKVSGEKEDIMTHRRSFTMQDIVDGCIMFRSNEREDLAGEAGSLEVWVSDGVLSAPRQVIPIVTPHTPLHLTVHNPLVLRPNHPNSAILGPDVLDVNDGGEVMFKLIQGPAHGQLVHIQHPDISVVTFSLDDLRASVLAYHMQTDTQGDHIMLQARRGSSLLNVLVSITALKDESPVLLKVAPLYVEFGHQVAALTRDNLLAEAGRDDSVAKDEIVFRLVTLPQYGVLLRGQQILRQDAGFSQADINSGIVTYQHRTQDTKPDCFLIKVGNIKPQQQRFCVYILPSDINQQVTQGGHYVRSETAINQHKTITPTIGSDTNRLRKEGGLRSDETEESTPYNPRASHQSSESETSRVGESEPKGEKKASRERGHGGEGESLYTWGESTRAGGGYSNDFLISDQMVTMVTLPPTQIMGLMVHGHEPTPITSEHLSMVLPDTEPHFIHYQLARALGWMAGRIEVVSPDGHRPSVPEANGFTQEDINEGRVIYHPDEFKQKRKIHLRLKVTDEKHMMKFPEKDFFLWLVPPHSTAPRLAAPVAQVMVPQGRSVVLGTEVIALHDPSDPEMADLLLEIKELPFAGILQRQASERQPLSVGDVMSYEDIVAGGRLIYTHGGSNTLQDGIHLLLRKHGEEDEEEDGEALELKIMIVRGDLLPPYRDSQAAWTLTVDEGKDDLLWRRHMHFADPDTNSADLHITMATDTQHGTLSHHRRRQRLRAGDSFTQDDINRGNIQYSSSSMFSSQPVTEHIFFNVTDAGGNILSWQPFFINIIPNTYKGPMLKIKDSLDVLEGSKKILSSSLVSVSSHGDGELPDSALIVIHLTQPLPQYGYLENNRRGGHRVEEFTLADLEDGQIEYIQADSDGIEPALDTLHLYATDGQNSSPVQPLKVQIESVNDEAPVVEVHPLQVEPLSSAALDNYTVFITDPDSLPHEIHFTMGELPKQGDIKKKRSAEEDITNAEVLEEGGSFDYQDILDAHIFYHHQRADTSEPDTITLYLSDGQFTETIYITVLTSNPIRGVSNTPLLVYTGSVTPIPGAVLLYTSLVHEDIMYTLIAPPSIGRLQLVEEDQEEAEGDVMRTTVVRDLQHNDAFTQNMVNQGQLQFAAEEESGVTLIEFTVTDGRANSLPQQSMEIIVEAPVPSSMSDNMPVLVINEPLMMLPGQSKTITDQHLHVFDSNTKPEALEFAVTSAPHRGLLRVNGRPSTHFTMADILAGTVDYVHTGKHHTAAFAASEHVQYHVSESQERAEIEMDGGDSKEQDGIGERVLQGPGQTVYSGGQEAVYRPIDTEVEEMFIKPGHVVNVGPQGVLGMQTGDDIRVEQDFFEFIVMDENSNGFVTTGSTRPTHNPQAFIINIMESAIVPEDGIEPVIEHNGGIEQLQMQPDGQISAVLWASSLSSEDKDTPAEGLMYEIVRPPLHGKLQRTDRPNEQVEHFTQADINNGHIRYVLTGNASALVDSFEFDVLDSRPNILHNNIFSISWSALGFSEDKVQVTEAEGVAKVPVDRYGNLDQECSVTCSNHDKQTFIQAQQDGTFDAMAYSETIEFGKGEARKNCNVPLNVYNHDPGNFKLHLLDPSNAILSDMPGADVTVIDTKVTKAADIPIVTLAFTQPTYTFPGESEAVTLTVLRQGDDLTRPTFAQCVAELKEQSVIAGDTVAPLNFSPYQEKQRCSFNLTDQRPNAPETFTVSLLADELVTLLYPAITTITLEPATSSTRSPPPPQHALVEFASHSQQVAEEAGSVVVMVTRSGNLNVTSSVLCFTEENTATEGIDFMKHTRREQRIKFRPGEDSKKCEITLFDDTVYEMDELFYIRLRVQDRSKDDTQLGMRDSVAVTLTDQADIPQISFEQSVYTSSAAESTNTVGVVRRGDLNTESMVQWSFTPPGPVENKEDHTITFKPGMSHVNLDLPGLTHYYTGTPITLMLHSPVHAVITEPSSTSVTPHHPSTHHQSHDQSRYTSHDWRVTVSSHDSVLSHNPAESPPSVLPAPPVVKSLSVVAGANQILHDVLRDDFYPAGQPLVCITPCEPEHPQYVNTAPLCAGLNTSSIQYSWQVAMPAHASTYSSTRTGSTPSVSFGGGGLGLSGFEEITDDTCFTSVHEQVLDSIYYQPHFRIRCVASLPNGRPYRSPTITIATEGSTCPNIVQAGRPRGYKSSSFSTRLQYVEPTAERHPNTLHISVHIPHQDGMLPIVSTLPIHNLRLLLTPDPIYRTHHSCSNLIMDDSDLYSSDFPASQSGFLNSQPLGSESTPSQSLYTPPIQTQALYSHLDVDRCTWQFDAWYSMTDLVDTCNGAVVSDFEVRDSAHSYLTVRVPLYVSYIFTQAPRGWSQIDHATTIESSFFYNTVHWRAGLNGPVGGANRMGGDLQLLKVSTGEDGKLVLDFRTQAYFRGKFILEDPKKPADHRSEVIAPFDLPLTFDLVEVWGQQTMDSPVQVWRAVSQYTLKDYTGDYRIELLVCVLEASDNQCTVQDKPTTFELPVVYEQTIRPVPISYSLGTDFDLRHPNNKEDNSLNVLQHDQVYKPGEQVEGYVSWDPDQSLNTTFRLLVEKVYICTGKDGYIPTFDPTGSTYNDGPQYGCLEPGDKVQNSMLILDRGDLDSTTQQFNGVNFNAQFVEEGADTGRDGFSFSVNPLYQSTRGYEWYVQVIFVIGPANKMLHPRYTRDLDHHHALSSVSFSAPNHSPTKHNGTNMQALALDHDYLDRLVDSANKGVIVSSVLAVVLFLVLLGLAVCCVVGLRKRKRRKQMEEEEIREENEGLRKGRRVLHEQSVVRCTKHGRHFKGARPASGTEV